MNDGIIGTWSYRAGDWYAVFGMNTTLLLPASERERVATLWALVDSGADFTQVLDALLASGLSTLRGFVLVGADVGPTRILLRGDGVRASLTTADETFELEGAGTTTWVERTVDDVTTLAVTVGDPVDAPDFAIDGGLVRVSRIDLPPTGQQQVVDVEAETVLPPGVAAGLAGEIRLRAQSSGPALSERERQVLQGFARGLSVPQVAKELFLGASTVKTHTQRLYEKLGVSDRAAAVAEGMRRGLVE